MCHAACADDRLNPYTVQSWRWSNQKCSVMADWIDEESGGGGEGERGHSAHTTAVSDPCARLIHNQPPPPPQQTQHPAFIVGSESWTLAGQQIKTWI